MATRKASKKSPAKAKAKKAAKAKAKPKSKSTRKPAAKPKPVKAKKKAPPRKIARKKSRGGPPIVRPGIPAPGSGDGLRRDDQPLTTAGGRSIDNPTGNS